MKLALKLTLFCYLLPMALISQPTADYVTVFQMLELRLQKGDRLALKEVGDFLGDQRTYMNNEGQQTTLHTSAQQLLKHYTLLQSKELSEAPFINRKEFLKFYYQREKQWQFSEFLQVFYLSPIDALSYKYRLIAAQSYNETNKQAIFRHYKREFLQAIKFELYAQVPEILERIAQLKTPQGFVLLRRCLLGRYWKVTLNNTFALRLYEATCYALRHYQNLAAAQMILKAIKEEKTYLQGAIEALSYITNIHLKALKVPFNKATVTYGRLLNQHKTLAALRDVGYKQLFDYEPFHFKSKADYYGKILNTSYGYFWVRYNALQDLKKIRDPKVLWYLAAQVFQQKGATRYNWQIDTNPMNLLRSLTRAEVLVPNINGTWTTELKDKTARLNFVRYWQEHYKDYRWDATLNRFVNTQEEIKENPQSERFRREFKKLHSRDQRVATAAFEKLANEQPLIALQSLPEQKFVIFPQSYRLPVYPYLSLEVLIRLRNYCESEGLTYLMHQKTIKEKATDLNERVTTQKRIELENELYKSLNLNNITALEHWAILSENLSWRLGYSLGRVLQRFYSNYRDSLFQQPKHLKLFMNKCVWFAKLRPKGLGAKYLSFLGNISTPEQQQLDKIRQEIENKEKELPKGSEGDVRSVQKDRQDLKLIIAQIGRQPIFGLHSAFTRFVKEPHAKYWQKLNGVKVTHPDDYRVVVEHIRKFRNPEKIQWLLSWLKFQKAPVSVPYLMQIVNDQRVIGKHQGYKQYIPLTVSDEVVFTLEQIYRHSFIDAKDFHRAKPRNIYRFSKNTLPWRKKWAKDQVRYIEWEGDFFAQKLQTLVDVPQLKINTVNNILLSPHFRADEQQFKVLEGLVKVHPQSDLAYLQWRLPLRAKDLKYFRNGFQYPALLKRLVVLLEARPDTVLSFLKKEVQKLSNVTQGKLFFELGQTTELWHWLKNDTSGFNQQVINCLQAYKLSLDSEYATNEVEANCFLLTLQDLPLKALLKAIKKITNEPLKNEILIQLVLQIRYAQVPELLDNLTLLKNLAPNYDVIHTRIGHHLRYNLGLPLDANFEKNLQARRDFKKLSEVDFFKKYIIKWYPGLISAVEQKKWVYLHNALKQSSGVPLVGVGSEETRLYALIRFLEISFNTKLGFPPNMYSAQNWSEQIAIKSWQQKWLQFLLNKSFKTVKKLQKY